MWVIGIDYGMKHWGLAKGIYGIVEPIGVVEAQGGIPDWQTLLSLVKPWNQGRWVIGYPMHSDGTLMPIARTLDRHLPHLKKNMKGSIIKVDEFYTTKEAQELLAHRTKITRQEKDEIDCMSACLILERYYDMYGVGDAI